MKSIRRQLAITMLAGFGALLLLSSIAIYFLTRAALLNEFDSGLRAKALAIMSLTEQGADGVTVELPGGLFQQSGAAGAPQFYEVWSTNEFVCARSASLDSADLPRRFGTLAAPEYWDLPLPGGIAGRAVGLKFSPKAEDEDDKKFNSHDAALVIAADRRSLDRTLQTLAGVLIATALLTIAITVPLVGVALRRGHAPLEELGRQAAAITADSLQSRFSVNEMPEELRPIAQRLNDLLARLENSFARERRFSADIAHELRTPLAELRAHAEVQIEFTDGADAEKHRETLDIALQMEAMVTRLLELARSESGKMPVTLEAVPLAPFVETLWLPLADKAKARQLHARFDIPANAVMQADRELLHSIIANLLSNAVEYSPSGGRIEVRGDGGLLTVANTVADLSAEDVPHLFERLWRKDKSRTGTEHCGLGLSLSREFARLMGMTLTAELNQEKMLTLSLRVGKN